MEKLFRNHHKYDVSHPTWTFVCWCACVFSETTAEISFPPISQDHAKDYLVMFMPDSAGVFSFTTADLLRLTKNDRPRASKPSLTHTRTHTHTASEECTHLRPIISPPPTALKNTHVDTQTPLWYQSHFPRGRLCFCPPRLNQGVKIHTSYIEVPSINLAVLMI